MNIALAQLALVFLPGIIWARLDATYGAGPKVDKTTLALNSFLFGVATYVVVYFVYWLSGWDFSTLSIADDEVGISNVVDEIAVAFPCSVLLAVGWLYSVRYRLSMRALNAIGATTRFGLEDVWSFTFNSDHKHVQYVDIRDLKNGFVHSGYVNAYSETEDFREILLLESITYDSEGDEVSRAPHLYLSFSKDNIWIDFPYSE